MIFAKRNVPDERYTSETPGAVRWNDRGQLQQQWIIEIRNKWLEVIERHDEWRLVPIEPQPERVAS